MKGGHLSTPSVTVLTLGSIILITASAIIPLLIIPLFLFLLSSGRTTLQSTQSTQYIEINAYSNVTPFTITINNTQRFQFQTKYGVIEFPYSQNPYLITFSENGYATVSCYLVPSSNNAPDICRIKQINAAQNNQELVVYCYATYSKTPPSADASFSRIAKNAL